MSRFFLVFVEEQVVAEQGGRARAEALRWVYSSVALDVFERGGHDMQM